MTPKSILIVEDEAVVALDLSLLLEKSGYRVTRICNSSDQLFDEINCFSHPDLILMDVHIKGSLDGTEASLKIKKLYNIPVIFLTAYADRDTITKAKNSYPYGYIIKPYDKRKLLIIIEMGLNIIELEKEVKRREELFSTTFNSIADAVIITDSNNRIQYMNPVAEAMIPETAVLDRIFSEIFQIKFDQNAGRGFFIDKAGKEKTLEIKKNKLNELHSQNSGYVWTLTDITIPVFLESQLRESQKMEAVGRLAGGIAHDFNNLLTVIMGYCSLILDNGELMSLDESLKSDILGIQTTSQKAVKLTKQLLTFSSNQVHSPRHVNLNEVVRDLDGIFIKLIPDDIQINVNLTDENTIINIDPVHLEQIVINLVVNSRDAIFTNGQIEISTAISQYKDHYSNLIKHKGGGDFVLFTIEDDGIGISEEIHSKIFEPFFSTKKIGKGTGLGLSTVYGIVQNSGGFIDLQSSPDKGCKFNIYFPRVLDAIPEDISTAVLKNQDAGKEIILVVEEDEFVRSIMMRILNKKNYSVIEAKNAGEAIILSEKTERPIELLITDLFMPLISGVELSNRIGRIFPDVRTLYTSTHNQETIKDEILIKSVLNFIQKPFDPEDFSLLVRKSLDSN